MHAPMGRDTKRGEEALRNVETGVGSGAKRSETPYDLDK